MRNDYESFVPRGRCATLRADVARVACDSEGVLVVPSRRPRGALAAPSWRPLGALLALSWRPRCVSGEGGAGRGDVAGL